MAVFDRIDVIRACSVSKREWSRVGHCDGYALSRRKNRPVMDVAVHYEVDPSALRHGEDVFRVAQTMEKGIRSAVRSAEGVVEGEDFGSSGFQVCEHVFGCLKLQLTDQSRGVVPPYRPAVEQADDGCLIGDMTDHGPGIGGLEVSGEVASPEVRLQPGPEPAIEEVVSNSALDVDVVIARNSGDVTCFHQFLEYCVSSFEF